MCLKEDEELAIKEEEARDYSRLLGVSGSWWVGSVGGRKKRGERQRDYPGLVESKRRKRVVGLVWVLGDI